MILTKQKLRSILLNEMSLMTSRQTPNDLKRKIMTSAEKHVDRYFDKLNPGIVLTHEDVPDDAVANDIAIKVLYDIPRDQVDKYNIELYYVRKFVDDAINFRVKI